jgi:hypothetical protein
VENTGTIQEPATNQRRHSPQPSTSRNRSSFDPLAKARNDWNEGIKAEYFEKFQKWSLLKKNAAKNSGTLFLIFIFYDFRNFYSMNKF